MSIQFLDSNLIQNFITEDMYDSINEEVMYVPRNRLLFEIYDKLCEFPRDQAFHGEVEQDGTTPLYRSTGETPLVNKWTHSLQRIRDALEERTGYSNNHVVVNRYLSGHDYIGFHHDKTRDFVENTPVCSVSFGGPRTLRLKHVDTNETKNFQLKNGCLFILGPQTNRIYKHCIVKTAAECQPRISCTFRNIRTKRRPDGRIIS